MTETAGLQRDAQTFVHSHRIDYVECSRRKEEGGDHSRPFGATSAQQVSNRLMNGLSHAPEPKESHGATQRCGIQRMLHSPCTKSFDHSASTWLLCHIGLRCKCVHCDVLAPIWRRRSCQIEGKVSRWTPSSRRAPTSYLCGQAGTLGHSKHDLSSRRKATTVFAHASPLPSVLPRHCPSALVESQRRATLASDLHKVTLWLRGRGLHTDGGLSRLGA